jgi:hypothetical protein
MDSERAQLASTHVYEGELVCFESMKRSQAFQRIHHQAIRQELIRWEFWRFRKRNQPRAKSHHTSELDLGRVRCAEQLHQVDMRVAQRVWKHQQR